MQGEVTPGEQPSRHTEDTERAGSGHEASGFRLQAIVQARASRSSKAQGSGDETGYKLAPLFVGLSGSILLF
jgi:hypothetical protein